MTTFGVAVPFYDHQSDYEALLTFARRAQALGFDGLWLSDHLVVGPPPKESRTWYDAPTLLAGLAGQVLGMTLGTDVLIVPYRHPFLAAKMLATLDVLSGGRLIVGVGAGHSQHEFDVLDAPFAGRGEVIDEYLQLWKAVWTEGPAVFAGRHVHLDEPELGPRPVSTPHPPIWVGGNGPAAIRRAARFGDGWHPLAIPPAVYAAGAAQLAELAERAGRPMPTLSFSGYFGEITPKPVDTERRVPLTGGVQQVLDDVGAFREIGVTNFVFRLAAPHLTNAQILDQLELVATDVLPHAR